MSYRVQFYITDEEYEKLKEKVAEKGVSISKFIKDIVFEEDSFESLWDEFLEKLMLYPKNEEFNIADIMTPYRWNMLNKHSKLSLARLFSKKVKAGDFPQVIVLGRIHRNNVTHYKKI